MKTTPISYDWLLENGWHQLPRFERQPQNHCRRCIGRDVIGDLWMAAAEDLCLDLAPLRDDCAEWFCWVVKATSPNNHAMWWIHVRQLRHAEELILLYEALTGRRFSSGRWGTDPQPIGQQMFAGPERNCGGAEPAET